ncbi:DUF2750 domain-containing protein [Alteromonas sp. ASW11-130]|uniref:DUF2750 domain-containing protein n=1 Tax=Alteromonas sp. ASW11-130 TaxID=3015775 RepID=UPI00224271A8|nr:DUF2750 domain-containing protein [Alteromonas sp. ASW11-130]
MFPHTVTHSLPDNIITQAAALSAEERLELFLTYVAKAGEIWALVGNNGYVMMEMLEGSCLPVWPHKQLVQCWHRSAKTDAMPQPISLDEFLVTWLPGLEKNNTSVAVFPTAEHEAEMLLTANELKSHLLDGVE